MHTEVRRAAQSVRRMTFRGRTTGSSPCNGYRLPTAYLMVTPRHIDTFKTLFRHFENSKQSLQSKTQKKYTIVKVQRTNKQMCLTTDLLLLVPPKYIENDEKKLYENGTIKFK